MVTVQQSLQHASSKSLCGNNARLALSPARMSAPARRALHVQALAQPDLLTSAATLGFTVVNSAFWTGVVGGGYGAFNALTQPGKKDTRAVVDEVMLNARGSMYVGGLMGLAHGTLLNVGLESNTAAMGGVALGLGLYAALVAASNRPR